MTEDEIQKVAGPMLAKIARQLDELVEAVSELRAREQVRMAQLNLLAGRHVASYRNGHAREQLNG